MKTWIIRLAILTAAGGAGANNLCLTNMVLKPRDDSTAYAQFNIRWDNSWRYTNINHDAAWVFFKVKPEGRSDWEHVALETNGHVTGAGTPIDIIVPGDRVGFFIRRTGEGSGVLSVTNVKVAWNFASNSLVKTDRVRLQAFAVEMVYVAAGNYWVGDGTTLNIQGQFEAGTNGTPFQITNESYEIILGGGGADSLGDNNGSGMWTADDFSDSTSKTLPAPFPKGYAAFYCMKYEVTQGQYRDFLNSLTRVQQIACTGSQVANYFALSASAAIVGRNGIRCPSFIPLSPSPIVFGCDGNANNVMNQTNDAMDRACNYLSWARGAAFMDWAGLRPLSELEFEKACRGPRTPVADEYAWGSSEAVEATGSLPNDGSGQEATTNGNYINISMSPVRVGIYAKTNSTRQAAGASYWGIMELSGNVTERQVSVGKAAARLFTGLHGDGRLNALGNANVDYWPGTDGVGASYRGGHWETTISRSRISSRVCASGTGGAGQESGSGGCRAGRSAPSAVEP